MDYSKLRDAALGTQGEDEEAVTVDTRALIDKVLARYSGEWTTLRELIQNAADAQATTVKISWETLPSTTVPIPSTTNRSDILKHILTNHTLRRLVVSNDGQPFAKTDWGRLKRIAEGNPDETKIGAFGVGFYSVFADCEEPFVSSGPEAMAFYWKGNALFTRKLVLPQEQATPDTAFVLDYRNTTTPVPNLLSVGQFLATSLTFVALQNIEFWIDDYKVLSLTKKSSPSIDVAIPRDLETRTKEGIMKLAAVDRTSAQIDASFMSAVGWKPTVSSSAAKTSEGYGTAEVPSIRSFFSRLTSTTYQSSARTKAAKEEAAVQEAISEDITSVSTSSIFLRVTSGSISTHVSASFAAELLRATKKPPPKVTKLSILTSSYDETMASESSTTSGPAAKAANIFTTILPSKAGGRVFIGFPTAQTTGGGMHISAPSVIPTVERESIDLNARWVRTWNIEMLRVAGIMTRLSFAGEMSDLATKLGAKPANADVLKYVPEVLHIFKTYLFRDSTPSAHVAQIIEESFWTAFKKPSIEVYSSRGVRSTTQVRVASEEMAKFVEGIPVVLNDTKDDGFIKKCIDFGLIKDITVDDVRQELDGKALSKDQLGHFLRWAGQAASTGELDPASRNSLLGVAVATIGESEDSGEIIALASITSYLNTNKIPATLPLPPYTIPFVFTNSIPLAHLQALGWGALEIVPWVRFLLEDAPRRPEEENLTTSPKFAAQILVTLSKNWDSLSESSKSSVVSALQNRTVVPTKAGMKKPAEAFFSSVKLFDDLPTLQGCQNIKDKFLLALGVRKTVDLDTIFARLLNPSAGGKKWSHIELIKYLTSVQEDMPVGDLRKLKDIPTCPAEAGPPGMESTQPTTQLYKISELFEPKSELRALGLPLLQWPGPPGSFRPSGKEGRFLAALGLRAYPSVPELVEMMASSDLARREAARNYFIANHHINGYVSFNIAGSNKAILPLQGNEKQLVPPSACYTNEGAAVLGFNILKRELHQHAGKFGVARDPPVVSCVDKLVSKPPTTHVMAITLFEYFTSRLNDLGEGSLAKLRDAAIVPVIVRKLDASREKSTETMKLVRPQHVYLGTASTYGNIFDFVDFGSNANTFLFKCGAKIEPSKIELARLACTEPARLSTTLQSPEKYLALLTQLADELSTLKKDKELYKLMKTQPWLYAYREISSSSDDDTPIKQYFLAKPSDIVIVDDYFSYRLFKDSLTCAPEEEALENFYLALGAKTIGSLVQEEVKVGGRVEKQDGAVWLQKHVLERTKIFLHEFSKIAKSSIKHDARWLEKNLKVEIVRSVTNYRTLRGHNHSHKEQRSASSLRTTAGYMLYVAAEQGRPDMYQVGQSVCHLILSRPSQQAFFFFEPFLKLDLLDLRGRGYNVDRILRAKAEQARIAEEERRKALEAEEATLKERQEEWARQGKPAETTVQAPRTPGPKSPSHSMPGAFGPDSPEDVVAPPPTQQGKRPKSVFQSLTRRLGLDRDGEAQQQLENFMPQEPAQAKAKAAGSKPLGPGDDGRVTSPAVVQQNLLQAIKSTRAHDSDRVFSRPQTQEVKEQATYCDRTPEQNIVFAAQAPRGMKVYLDKKLTMDHMQWLSINSESIGSFESLLREVAGIYGVATQSLQIYYDETGPSIAFNMNGSIFCNLRFFTQLHHSKIKSTGADSGMATVEAVVWWWVVVAHELAHNLVSTHDANHSYYTESFVQEYFPKMMAKAVTMGQGGSNSNNIPVTTSSSRGVQQQQQPLAPPPPYRQQTDGPSLLD